MARLSIYLLALLLGLVLGACSTIIDPSIVPPGWLDAKKALECVVIEPPCYEVAR